ncbi:Beta-hexosaminidase subunit [Morus notabilis]|uniref:beta-N-acetylhexosaminidase n=1 Tax=Morus notabilis TaxID=981085 RepID=W9R2A8_9ROSA|nr:Beta-hexosaminidase subunit [Morus notabilis]
MILKSLTAAIFLSFLAFSPVLCDSVSEVNASLPYLWPLPSEFTSGNDTLSVDPALSLALAGSGGRGSAIVRAAFDRYKGIIFNHANGGTSRRSRVYDIRSLKIVVDSDSDELQLGVDESYELFVAKNDGQSVVGEATIEANTVYGALRGLETFSQLCTFDYESKSVLVYQAPWYIQDKPRFAYRGLLLDTSRHYFPKDVIKQIIDSMSYAKLNVLHWHVIDEQSFSMEIPSYPNLWRGAYTKWERYTVEDAIEIVMGAGYPDLWPSSTCREPLDVSKNFTFDVVSGILEDLRKIFPFELFHLGGDEVNTTLALVPSVEMKEKEGGPLEGSNIEVGRMEGEQGSGRAESCLGGENRLIAREEQYTDHWRKERELRNLEFNIRYDKKHNGDADNLNEVDDMEY